MVSRSPALTTGLDGKVRLRQARPNKINRTPGLQHISPALTSWPRRMAALITLLAACSAAPAWSQPAAAVAPSTAASAQASKAEVLVLNHRPIAHLRATVLGRPPVDRVILAQAALDAVLRKAGPGQATVWMNDGVAGLQVDGSIVFYLAADDIEGPQGTTLAQAADEVRRKLQIAVQETREATDLRRIAIGLGMSLLASAIAWLLVRGGFALRRKAVLRASMALDGLQARDAGRGLTSTYAHYARYAAHGSATVLVWALVLLLLDLWVTFVLGQFAYTRPWAEASEQWLLNVLAQFATAIANAVPGLLTAGLIFLIARLVARALTAFMHKVERGELQVGWLDGDTAGPTRRIGNFVIWLFALAMAYPFLPGANSEAFKGVSVLAGLMLSLGASGVVGQVVSGLSLMYSRSLRVGEYVRIGDVDGTVAVVGLFATKVHTGMGVEVSLPNSVVFGQPVHNFSRQVHDGQFMLHTAVTIGYATPWRQVHAMLLEAARRAPGVADEPAPYVVQTALSDFYVEYRLCAQSNRSAPRRRAEAMSQLHGHVQDVFNENGVQIMSPHYRSDPATPQVVPPSAWAPDLAPAASPRRSE